MKNNNILQYTLITFFAMAAVAMFRLVPHPLNFVPVTAIALYGGARGKNVGFSFLLPLLVMIASDLLVMQFLFPERGNPFNYLVSKDALSVYFAFILVVCVGLLLKRNIKTGTVIGASLGSSLLFFIVTNFFTWYGAPFYEQSFKGLLQCYYMAIPFYENSFGPLFGSFFVNQIMGDLFFTGVLFGAHALAARTIMRPANA